MKPIQKKVWQINAERAAKMTLEEIDEKQRKMIEKGRIVICALCEGTHQKYWINLSKPLAVLVKRIYKKEKKGEYDEEGGWLKGSRFGNAHSYIRHLEFFGLAETKAPKSGLWKLTKNGRKFYRGKFRVRKYVRVYEAVSERHFGAKIYIKEAFETPRLNPHMELATAERKAKKKRAKKCTTGK